METVVLLWNLSNFLEYMLYIIPRDLYFCNLRNSESFWEKAVMKTSQRYHLGRSSAVIEFLVFMRLQVLSASLRRKLQKTMLWSTWNKFFLVMVVPGEAYLGFAKGSNSFMAVSDTKFDQSCFEFNNLSSVSKFTLS